MANITGDGTSAVTQYLDGAMTEHELLYHAIRKGTDAVVEVIKGSRTGGTLLQAAIDECRSDPLGSSIVPKLESLNQCMAATKSAAVRASEFEHPQCYRSGGWMESLGEYNDAVNALMPFCRKPKEAERTADGKTPKAVITKTINRFGRKPDEAVAERRREVVKLNSNGKSHNEIYEIIDNMRKTGKLAPNVPLSIDIIKQDIGRSRGS